MNPHVEAAVKKALKDAPRTSENKLSAFNVYEAEDGSEVFVEAVIPSHKMSTGSLTNYVREIALALLSNSDEDEKVHLAVFMYDRVGRLTLDPRYRDLSQDELRGRIGQSLRLS